MIFNVYSLENDDLMAKFSNRIDAQGYIDFNEPDISDLYYRAERELVDFSLYKKIYSYCEVMSKVGGTYFC